MARFLLGQHGVDHDYLLLSASFMISILHAARAYYHAVLDPWRLCAAMSILKLCLCTAALPIFFTHFPMRKSLHALLLTSSFIFQPRSM